MISHTPINCDPARMCSHCTCSMGPCTSSDLLILPELLDGRLAERMMLRGFPTRNRMTCARLWTRDRIRSRLGQPGRRIFHAGQSPIQSPSTFRVGKCRVPPSIEFAPGHGDWRRAVAVSVAQCHRLSCSGRRALRQSGLARAELRGHLSNSGDPLQLLNPAGQGRGPDQATKGNRVPVNMRCGSSNCSTIHIPPCRNLVNWTPTMTATSSWKS